MNKKLLAVAIAGLLAAPLAQAQTANVTLYGRVNLDVEFVNGKIGPPNNTTNPNVYRLGSNSSRFGLRGTESLGGGLNAIFQVESSINPAQSGGTLAGRESFVGFQGGWGTFKMGRFLTPYDDIHPIFGNVPTLTTSILSTASLWANGYQSTNTGGFDDRVQNSVRYDTPNISGFTASIQYGGTGNFYPTSGTPHAGVFSVGAFYNNGPLQLGTAYTNNNSVRAAGLNDWAFSVAGGYDFGVVRPALVYERLDYEVATGHIERNMYGVSLTAPAGPGQLYAYFGQASDGKGSAADGSRVAGTVKGADTRANQWSLSYTYPFSKRTLVYTGYNKIANDTKAQYNFNINPYNPISSTDSAYATPGGKPGGFVMGAVHFF
jgi:predicted porin